MKKTLSVLTALLPVMYVLSLVMLFLLDAADDPLFTVMIGYCIAATVLHILFCTHTAKAEPSFLAVSNVWLYAWNLALFLFEIVYWLVQLEQTRIAEQNGAIGGGLGLVLLILIYLPHWFSYLLTHITGAISCERTLQGICGGGVRAANAFLQLIPITDLVSAVWVLSRVRKTESME